MIARDNPFAVHRVLAVRYSLPGTTTWDDLVSAWERMGQRGAIVGPHGAGKTTLLEDFAERLEAAGWTARWLRLSEDCRKFPPGFLARWTEPLGAGDCVLVDGAEQMSWWTWGWFERRCRRAGGMVATAHASGRLPTLHECRTDAALLAGIVERLAGPGTWSSPGMVQPLFERHRGNVRDALRELYDRAAGERGERLKAEG